jgi:hypothetical protein
VAPAATCFRHRLFVIDASERDSHERHYLDHRRRLRRRHHCADALIGHYSPDQGAGFITATIGALVVLFIWNRLVARGMISDPGNR